MEIRIELSAVAVAERPTSWNASEDASIDILVQTCLQASLMRGSR